jgi:hypothetical protein
VFETILVGHVQKHLTQMRFAVEASVGFVGDEISISQFVCVNNLEANFQVFGKFFRPLQDVLWLDDTGAYAREDVFNAQRINGNFQQKGAVNTAGIGDEDAAQFGK